MAGAKSNFRRLWLAATCAAIVATTLTVPLWLPGVPDFPGAVDTAASDAQVQLSEGDESASPTEAAASQGKGQPGPLVVEESADSDGVLAEHEVGTVLVELSEGASATEVNAVLAGSDVVAKAEVTDEDVEIGCAVLSLTDGVSVRDAARELEASDVVEGAQPNYVYRLAESSDAALAAGLQAGISGFSATASVNDPYASAQWTLSATNADSAFTAAESAGRTKMTIAVIDTGCYYNHADLKANIVAKYDAVEKTVPNKSNGNFDVDYDAHGTHVAGIASAVTNNGIGIAGMGGNSGLFPVNVFEYDNDGNLGADSATIARAYNYIIANASAYNVKVINMSLGSDLEEYGISSDDVAVHRCIDQAYRAGIVVVASAGNDADSYGRAYGDWPTYCVETCVGAISLGNSGDLSNTSRSYFSNYNKTGMKVEQLAAPGYSILSTNDNWWYDRGSLSNYFYDGKWYNGDGYPSSAYVVMSGTSMAAPCISGLAALVWSTNPSLSPDELKSVLYSTAKNSGFTLTTGFGCVDALAAVKANDLYLKGATSAVPGVSVTLAPSAAALAKSTRWTWTSSDPAVATVSGGKVTGLAAGSTVITASSGSMKLMQVVTVHGNTMSGASSLSVFDSSTFKVSEPVVDNGVWNWASSNPAVASVSSTTGVVTGRSAGSATITATLSTNSNVKVSKVVAVGKASMASATVKLAKKSYTYNGKAKRPSVTVKIGGTKLAASNYTVKYTKNRNAGKAKVTVSAKGSLVSGSKAVSFTIKKASVKSVKLSKSSYYYDGMQKSPKVTVKGPAGKKLKSGRDYKLKSPGGRVNWGSYKYVATGKGNYKGKRTAWLYIW